MPKTPLLRSRSNPKGAIASDVMRQLLEELGAKTQSTHGEINAAATDLDVQQLDEIRNAIVETSQAALEFQRLALDRQLMAEGLIAKLRGMTPGPSES